MSFIRSSDPISSPKLVKKWEYKRFMGRSTSDFDPCLEDIMVLEQLPFFYEKLQALVQSMLHSEFGVPIRSHRNRLLSAVPSVFTGSDVINWLIRRFQCTKSEAEHVALLVYKHGYYYSVDKDEFHIKEDSTLFRFQTPHLWPSQNFDDSDYTYSIFLLKQIKRSKNTKGVQLLDYQLSDLRVLQQQFKGTWDEINAKADDEVRVLKEQRKIAKQLIVCQERAFWRIRRPPPGESKITDCFLTKFGMAKSVNKKTTPAKEETQLLREIKLLNKMNDTLFHKMATSAERVTQSCKKYFAFDPLLKTPPYGNPWTTNDDSCWILQQSVIEYPCEKMLKMWACSLHDMLTNVTGRSNFEVFCKKRYCSENIRFWQALEDLQLLPLDAVPAAVTMIYSEFIDPSAESMVNISAEAFSEAEKDILNPSRFSFSLAQKEVYKLMETDIYQRYLNSDHEKNLTTATTSNSIGRSFLKKFISRSNSSKSEIVTSPVENSSPCNPKRYTSRELSIGKKSDGGVGSLDNIFLASSSTSAPQFSFLHPPIGERRVSAPIIKYQVANTSTSSNLLYSNVRTPSPKSLSDSSSGLETLSEEVVNAQQHQFDVSESKNYELDSDDDTSHNNDGDYKHFSRKMQLPMMISRSLEDLSHLAQEDSDATMAMHQDTYQMGLMSLRNPVDQFNLFDATHLDRKKSGNTYDLHDPKDGIPPLVMTSFYGTSKTLGRPSGRPSVSSLGPNALGIPKPEVHSSNESVHSTISVY